MKISIIFIPLMLVFLSGCFAPQYVCVPENVGAGPFQQCRRFVTPAIAPNGEVLWFSHFADEK